ncbi:MAG: LysM domain-containing protein [Patescibacteria group bacterium]
MKIKLFIVLIIVLAMASVANAGTYKVRKGECLSQIAQKHGVSCKKLFEANKDKIKNLNLIFPNQTLRIPEKVKVVATSTAIAKTFLWKEAGANPFGEKRDFTKAIKLFNIPEEVKREFVALVNEGNSRDYQMERGQKFEQMIFGNYQVVNNVIVQINLSQLGAKIYSKSFGGQVYFLVCPTICNNWAWWKKKEKEEEKVVVQPFLEIVTKTEVLAIKKPEATATALLEKVNVTTVTEVKVATFTLLEVALDQPETVTTIVEELQKESFKEELEVATVTTPSFGSKTMEVLVCKKGKGKGEIDFTSGIFVEKFRDDNQVSGFWAVGTGYCFKNSSASYGLAIEHNNWRGRTGDGYDYKGSRLTIGPAYRHSNPTRTTTVRVGYGKRNDSGGKIESMGVYCSKQETNIISVYFSSEAKREGNFFEKNRITFSEDISVRRSREDSWTDASGRKTFLRNPAEDQSMVCAGVDSEVFSFDNNKNVVIGAGISSIYYFRNANLGKKVELGLYFFDRAIEIKSYYTDWSKSASSHGAGLVVNFSNLLKNKEEKEVKSADMDRSADVLRALGK